MKHTSPLLVCSPLRSLNGPVALLSDDAGGFYVTDTGVCFVRLCKSSPH